MYNRFFSGVALAAELNADDFELPDIVLGLDIPNTRMHEFIAQKTNEYCTVRELAKKELKDKRKYGEQALFCASLNNCGVFFTAEYSEQSKGLEQKRVVILDGEKEILSMYQSLISFEEGKDDFAGTLGRTNMDSSGLYNEYELTPLGGSEEIELWKVHGIGYGFLHVTSEFVYGVNTEYMLTQNFLNNNVDLARCADGRCMPQMFFASVKPLHFTSRVWHG